MWQHLMLKILFAHQAQNLFLEMNSPEKKKQNELILN